MSSGPGNNDRDRVLAATDILSLIGEVVALRPKGREHVGLCPFHDDRSPSLAVVTHKSGGGGSGFYKCFACGAAGNAIDFAINYHRMEFPEALRFLAARANIELTPWQGASVRQKAPGEPTRDDILRANALAERFFRRVFADADAGEKARAEASRRGFDAETTEAFGLGAAPSKADALVEGVRKALRNAGGEYPQFDAFVAAGVIRPSRSGGHVDLLRDRLVFPICDDLGRPIAFGGRKLDPEQEPKYLNSPESPVFHKSKALYGIHRAKRPIVEAKCAIITEGYTDVIACHRAGFRNAVATLGTALTREHARILRRMADTVVLLFDGDEAGQKAADRALDVFFSESIDIKICVLPDGLDPDDLLRQEGGSERFARALGNSADALSFVANRIRRQLEGRGLSGRQQWIEQTTAKFVDLGLNAMNGLRRQLVLHTLADLFDVPVVEIDRLAKSLRPRPIPGMSPSVGGSSPETGGSSSSPAGAGFHSSSVVEVTPSIGSAARARARREAERRLLSLLCRDPALAAIAVPVEGAGTLPISEAIAPGEFADPGHAAIFAAIRDAAEAARVLNFESLIGELADTDLKRLASDLYLLGNDIMRAASAVGASQARSATDEVLVSWSDLENLERRERFKASGSDFARNDPARNPENHEASRQNTQQDSERFHQGEGDSGAADGIRSARGLDPASAAARLARIRERGHDATAVSRLFQRRPAPMRDDAIADDMRRDD